VCIVVCVELLLLLNYCRRGTMHVFGSCRCGIVAGVKLLS